MLPLPKTYWRFCRLYKYVVALFLSVLFSFSAISQNTIDSLHQLLSGSRSDSSMYEAAKALYNYFEERNRDSALLYANEELRLAEKNNKKLVEATSLGNIGYQLTGKGKYALALKSMLRAFQIAEDPRNEAEENWTLFNAEEATSKRLLVLSYTHHMFAILMRNVQNPEKEIAHFLKARELAVQINSINRIMLADFNLGRSYLGINPDSALWYENESEKLSISSGKQKYLGHIYITRGFIYFKKNDKLKSLQDYHKGVNTSIEKNNFISLLGAYFYLSEYYLGEGNKDSSLYYSNKTLETFQFLGSVTGPIVNLGTIYKILYRSYELRKQQDSAYKYQGLALYAIDSLSQERIKGLSEFQDITFMNELDMQKMEKEKVVYQGRVRTMFLLGGIGVLLLLAIIFFRNNRQKHKANIKIEKAYENLKATQQQLIQSEKMASLGELTAGIAHEIQNPLNFVNNFSEINVELLAELKEGPLKNLPEEDREEANNIINDLDLNMQKIGRHGKRADGIVKGMLLHSRSSSGQKELTDLNALSDEYLRLAYHGLRAKDKSFNATLETDFDKKIDLVNVVPQDIGRVILNLINNAFYAVDEKTKLGLPDYQPTVSIKTKKNDNSISIFVKDNGNGIPQKVIDKIFQPFFSTKPTGQGTGLGLSMSYDIVKAHGGEIKVESREGEGTDFIVGIPL